MLILAGDAGNAVLRGTGVPERIGEVTLDGEAATEALGRKLATAVRRGDVIALSGPLGCGKSTLARAVVRALTGDETVVPSPTFTLLESYGPVAALGCPIHHIDLYRIGGRDELLELGIEDAMAEGVTLIEWPEKLGDLAPAHRLDIELGHGEGECGRRATLRGDRQWRARIGGLSLE